VAGENPSNWSRYNFFSHLKTTQSKHIFPFSQTNQGYESKRQKSWNQKRQEETTFSQRLRGALTYLLIATGVVISPRG
jgi:hypothetical protein